MHVQHSTEVHTEPVLRWAGSKRQVIDRLAAYWRSDYSRYVEPFAGSAALFFRIRPKAAVLADLNSELIHAYNIIKTTPDSLYQAVTRLPSGEDNYYRIREKDPSELAPLARAARFVYLNRHCFNGIYRTNLQGKFNVPFGGTKPGVIPPLEAFRKVSVLLRNASLRCTDFGQVLKTTKKGDFVYLDPPYVVESRRVFREYGPRGFSVVDLTRLERHLRKMDARGVHFVVSYADCAEAKAYLSQWRITRMRVRRHVSGFSAARRSAYELVATNVD